jgi:hypothetical protein
MKKISSDDAPWLTLESNDVVKVRAADDHGYSVSYHSIRLSPGETCQVTVGHVRPGPGGGASYDPPMTLTNDAALRRSLRESPLAKKHGGLWMKQGHRGLRPSLLGLTGSSRERRPTWRKSRRSYESGEVAVQTAVTILPGHLNANNLISIGAAAEFIVQNFFDGCTEARQIVMEIGKSCGLNRQRAVAASEAFEQMYEEKKARANVLEDRLNQIKEMLQ